MNREECLSAIRSIEQKTMETEDYESIPQVTFCCVDSELKILEQLINEHFNNTPLKFEDLEPNMWIWDNEDKMYLQIVRPLSYQQIFVNYYYEDYLSFEDGRYYAREVKEK